MRRPASAGQTIENVPETQALLALHHGTQLFGSRAFGRAEYAYVGGKAK